MKIFLIYLNILKTIKLDLYMIKYFTNDKNDICIYIENKKG